MVVEPQEPKLLAEAIRAVVEDPVLARRLGDAGRVRASTYSSAAVSEMVDDVYEQAMAAHVVDRNG